MPPHDNITHGAQRKLRADSQLSELADKCARMLFVVRGLSDGAAWIPLQSGLTLLEQARLGAMTLLASTQDSPDLRMSNHAPHSELLRSQSERILASAGTFRVPERDPLTKAGVGSADAGSLGAASSAHKSDLPGVTTDERDARISREL
jgi:hypothetical protein